MSTLPDIPGYDVEAEIGRGGMGVVYRVRDRARNIVRALKMMKTARKATYAEVARFRIEAEAHACLNHPNILVIRDVGLYQGVPYLVLEYAEGGSLQHSIASQKRTPRQTAELVRTIALAMQHAHERGMLHRDLKPANILLTREGIPKISDFGLVKFVNPVRDVSMSHCTVAAPAMLDTHLSVLARELGAQYRTIADAVNVDNDALTRDYWELCASRTGVLNDETRLQSVRAYLTAYQEQFGTSVPELDDLTRDGSVMGSPYYMAPEQAAGHLDRIGPHTDVYAIGGILYELLTGQPPFQGQRLLDVLLQVASTMPVPPRQMIPEVSADIEAICLKCLQKSPDDRYPSATALAEDLSRFLDGYAPSADRMAATFTTIDSSNSNAKPPVTVQDSVVFEDSPPTTTRSWWPLSLFGKKRPQDDDRP